MASSASDSVFEAVRFDPELGGWAVSSLAEAREVLNDDQTFSATAYELVKRDLSGVHAFLAAAPADHRRLRRTLASAVSQKWVSEAEQAVLAPLADSAARALVGCEEVDLIGEFIRPYSRQALFELVGIDARAGDELLASLRMAHASLNRTEPDSQTGLAAAAIAHEVALKSLPGPAASPMSLRSRLYASKSLSVSEHVLCLVPLFETFAIKSHHDLPVWLIRQLGTLDGEEQLVAVSTRLRLQAAAHEAVRLQPGGVLPRLVCRDVTLGGHRVESGSLVFVLLDRVGRDPDVFEGPDRFDPSRKQLGRYPGFGLGSHSCVGRRFGVALASSAARALIGLFEVDPRHSPPPRVGLTPRLAKEDGCGA